MAIRPRPVAIKVFFSMVKNPSHLPRLFKIPSSVAVKSTGYLETLAVTHRLMKRTNISTMGITQE